MYYGLPTKSVKPPPSGGGKSLKLRKIYLMKESQRNSLKQSQELLESAITNHLYKEIAKYLINNMNAIAGSMKLGWLKFIQISYVDYCDRYHIKEAFLFNKRRDI